MKRFYVIAFLAIAALAELVGFRGLQIRAQAIASGQTHVTNGGSEGGGGGPSGLGGGGMLRPRVPQKEIRT